jgi:uncharacterized RDD family membrane protein YckC
MKSAPLGRQLLSLLYEAFLLAGVWLSLVLFPQAIAATVLEAAAPGWAIWLHSVVLFGAFYGWLWTSGRQTLAMKTWKLRLVTDEGRSLALEHAVMRFFWAWPSYGLAGIGIVWAFFDPDGKLLHDRLAKTRLLLEQAPT